MSSPSPSPRPAAKSSFTDSPWYWVYLFAVGALIALLLMGPKFRSRQTQIERKYQGRQRAARKAVGQQPDTPMSEEGETLIDLQPLYAILLLVLAMGGLGLWLRRRRPSAAEGRSP